MVPNTPAEPAARARRVEVLETVSRYLPPRSFSVKALNAVGRLLRAVGVSAARLDEGWLLGRAARNAGLSDFGDEAFREPLRRVLRAYEEESRLTLVGRIIAQRDTLRILENRLHLIEARKRHPEMADAPIREPVFVVGLPRTGSTALHELLAQDPENRVPMTWEVMWPWPFPEAASYHSDRRIAKADRYLRATDQLIPGFKKMHRMGAELPQECCMLMNHDFMSMQLHTSNRIPSFQDWMDQQDMTPIYASHRRQLQHLQLRCPVKRGWVLKSPQHLWSLDALLAVYPDARIVQTHRDPVKVAASLSSLVSLLRGMGSDQVDPGEVGADWTRRLVEGLSRATAVRDRLELGESRVFDVHFRDFLADPLEMVRRIYSNFGMELGAEAERRMRRFLAMHPQNEHGRHEYALKGAGLDLETERDRFEAYQKRFDIPSEITG
jgi:hypothetical protein